MLRSSIKSCTWKACCTIRAVRNSITGTVSSIYNYTENSAKGHNKFQESKKNTNLKMECLLFTNQKNDYERHVGHQGIKHIAE